MKRNKGITLVALVITIIILLILAGITINSLTESGLFEKVKLAKEKAENAEELEDTTLGEYENEIGKYINGTRDEKSDNYSREETRIGTWIDGKPIYRKIFEKTYSPEAIFISGGTLYGEDYDLKDLETLIDARSMTTLNTGTMQSASTDLEMIVYQNIPTHKETYAITFNVQWSNVSRIFVIAEYTKTTD